MAFIERTLGLAAGLWGSIADTARISAFSCANCDLAGRCEFAGSELRDATDPANFCSRPRNCRPLAR